MLRIKFQHMNLMGHKSSVSSTRNTSRIGCSSSPLTRHYLREPAGAERGQPRAQAPRKDWDTGWRLRSVKTLNRIQVVFRPDNQGVGRAQKKNSVYSTLNKQSTFPPLHSLIIIQITFVTLIRLLLKGSIIHPKICFLGLSKDFLFERIIFENRRHRVCSGNRIEITLL